MQSQRLKARRSQQLFLWRTARNKRRGAAVVEFAVVAPIFFLLIFGIIEFGRVVMVQQIITNASREGARIAIVPGATTSQVTTAVNTYLTSCSIRGATATVSPDPASATYGGTVTVTVSVPFTSVSWAPSPFFLSATTLSARASCALNKAAVSSACRPWRRVP